MKIQAARASMDGTIAYNQRKVEKGVARVLCAVNIPSAFPEDVRETFARYENRNRMSQDVSFQLSINPDPSRPEERLSTNWEGKKINDYREKYRCRQLLKQYAQRFHYKVGGEDGTEKEAVRVRFVRFDPKAGDICNQYLSLFREAVDYRFCTLPQLKAVCVSKGLIMDTRDTPVGPDIVLQGADVSGKPVARMISGQEMKENLYGLYESRAYVNKRLAPVSRSERSSLARQVSYALTHSRSEESFLSMLSRRGIHASVFRSREGNIYGATFVDDRSKAVFKGSELPGITTAAYREADIRWNAAALREEAASMAPSVPAMSPSVAIQSQDEREVPEMVVEEREVDAVDTALSVASSLLGHTGDFGSASRDDSKVFKKKKQKVTRRKS